MSVDRERLLRAQELRSGTSVVGSSNPLPVTINGGAGAQDLRGLIGNRPAAGSVETGTTYWSVDRLDEVDEVSVSDGTNWQNV